MFDILSGESGTVVFSGRLDTAQAPKAQTFLEQLPQARIIDFAELEYISSAGLGVLLVVQKRLMKSGGKLRLINVNNHINDVFRYSGFDQIFEIERAGA